MAGELRRYHLGCGDKRLDGYVNVDVRETDAADLVLDLNELRLEPGSAEIVFSHAFFEHLLRDRREPHLRAARAALDSEEGAVCYLGLPDFRAIAKLYLDRGPGMVGPVFDLYEVYRYTHGDPEAAEGWHEQLHKSLFDEEEIDSLLTAAGFPSYVIFTYVFPGEPAPVTLGFFAMRVRRSEEELRERCLRFLEQFDGEFLELSTVTFGLSRSRTPGRANFLRTRIEAERAARGRASRVLGRLRERQRS